MQKNRYAFTIVELLVVIVVIAILAAITIVAYNGIQQRSRDAKRISDLEQIEKGLHLWSASTGKSFNEINAGYEGTGMGWFSGVYTSPVSTKQLLINNNLLSSGVQDPINTMVVNTSTFSYMISDCFAGDTTQRVVLAQLETPPAQSLPQQLGVTCNGTTYTTYTGSGYKMNYGRLVKLQP